MIGKGGVKIIYERPAKLHQGSSVHQSIMTPPHSTGCDKEFPSLIACHSIHISHLPHIGIGNWKSSEYLVRLASKPVIVIINQDHNSAIMLLLYMLKPKAPIESSNLMAARHTMLLHHM